MLGLSALLTMLVLYALKENVNFFYAPSAVQRGEVPIDTRIRMGGMVEHGSLHREDTGLRMSFAIVDGDSRVPVRYQGLLPDLFAEGRGAVVTGKLNTSGVLIAEYILAKHDENYQPPLDYPRNSDQQTP
jgi:cytochrome c-type biogenesis protein CcmE